MFQLLPESRRYTVFISALLLALIIYAIVTGNPYGWAIAAVLFVFIVLPASVIFLLNRHARRHRSSLHNGHDAELDATLLPLEDDQTEPRGPRDRREPEDE